MNKTSATDIERGRRLFAGRCQFITGATSLDNLPEANLPEIAFAGRSNVGKSSLINALTGRKNLARTSNTPGRTQQINFFELEKFLMLVDLPGYGYAQAPKDMVAQWTRLVNVYLYGRKTLKRTCLLLDARHGIKDNDLTVFSMLDKAATNYQLVLTKSDKLKPAQLAEVIAKITEETAKRPAAHPEILATSSETGHGIAELRAAISNLIPTQNPPPPFGKEG